MGSSLKMKWVFAGFLLSLAILLISTHAYAQKKIKIGAMGPMKFTRGEHVWLGSKLAVDEINAAGGVLVGGEKYEIELIKADTNEFLSIPDAVSTIEKLVKVDKVNFLVGGCRSEAALAQQEVMAEHKVIWANAGGLAAPVVTERVAKDYNKYKYFFKFDPAVYVGRVTAGLVNVVANKLRGELGIKTPRVALLMEKAKWVDPTVELAQGLLPKWDMEVVGLWRPSPMANDLTAELTAIKAAGAHIIYEVVSGSNGAVIGKQWGEFKIPAALVGINTEAPSKKYWEGTGKFCNYEASYALFGRIGITNKTIPFFDNFEKRYGDWAIQDAANYDCIYVFKEAVERAGSLNADAVIRELEKIDTKGVLGRYVFSPKEEWSKEPFKGHQVKWGPGYVSFTGLQWRDGKLMGFWPDGRALFEDTKWVGIKYEGTVDYKLPPWVVEYWKGK